MLQTTTYDDGPTRRRFLLLLTSSGMCAALPRVLAQGLALGLDRDGHPVMSLADGNTRVVVTLFVATDCPISNRYIPETLRLARQFRPRGARFWLVYPNPGDDVAAVRAHQARFAPAAAQDNDAVDTAALDTLIAPEPRFIQRAGVHVTPEAALFRAPFSSEQTALWHGRIDDRYLSIGTQRSAPTRHDLANAIAATLDGRDPAPATGRPVGCAIVPRTVGASASTTQFAKGSSPALRA